VFFDEWEVYGQTRQALQFLDECEPDKPFALFVSWHPPHDWGIHADSLVFRYDTIPELMDLYDPNRIKLRPSAQESPALRHAYHGYYAMCSGVDRAFGWLMDKLRQKGLAEDTLVVFTSDHGDNLQSYGHTIAKDRPEDTAARIPLLMRWPHGLPAQRASDLLVGPMDMMPTILGLMGLPIPNTVQGQDLSSTVLRGKDDAVESIPLFFYKPHWYGVYTHDVTYGFGRTRYFTRGPDRRPMLEEGSLRVLYDRRKDPYQLNNLHSQRGVTALRRKMSTLARRWMNRFGDPGLSAEQIDPLYRRPDGRLPEDTTEPGFRGRPIDVVRT
jgi:arylsulfatase A-like enzyme